METFAQRIAIFEEQERELQFDGFTNEDALQLGLLVVRLAQEGGKSITVDITRKGQRLFVHAMKGTSVGNEDWIRRKNNTAGFFGKSSWRVALELRELGRSIEEEHGLDTADYAAAGGAFPIVVRGEGMIGTITVSGLPDQEDHDLVVEAIRQYLAIPNKNG
jgi:uncharacterized protein (UPF0303 family)